MLAHPSVSSNIGLSKTRHVIRKVGHVFLPQPFFGGEQIDEGRWEIGGTVCETMRKCVYGTECKSVHAVAGQKRGAGAGSLAGLESHALKDFRHFIHQKPKALLPLRPGKF